MGVFFLMHRDLPCMEKEKSGEMKDGEKTLDDDENTQNVKIDTT